jgi:Tfp pilus assembly ATPase PilU
MNTMDQSLFDLYQRGEITYDVALSNARDPNYIRNQVEKEALTAIRTPTEFS